CWGKSPQVATGPFDPQQLSGSAGRWVADLAFGRGVPSAVVRGCGIATETVRATDELVYGGVLQWQSHDPSLLLADGWRRYLTRNITLLLTYTDAGWQTVVPCSSPR